MQKEEKLEISKLKLLMSIIKELKVAKKYFLILFPLVLINLFFINSEPYFQKLIIDALGNFIKTGTNSQESIKEIYFLIFLWGTFTLAGITLGAIYTQIHQTIISKDWETYINKLGLNFLKLKIDRHVSVGAGEQQKIYDRGAEAIWEVGYYFFDTILPQAISFIFLMAIGLYVNPEMTLYSVILVPFGIFLVIKIGSIAYEKQRKANRKWETFYSRFSNALENIFIIKMFLREEKEIELEKSFSDDAIKFQNSVKVNWIQLSCINQLLVLSSKIIVFAIGVKFLTLGRISLGDLFLFTGISNRIFYPLQQLLNAYQGIIKNLSNYYKSQKVLEEPKETDEGTIVFSGIKEKIEFSEINFSYPENTRIVLKNMNLEIKKGEKVALVGHTGSGKSTITKLLTRFYDLENNMGQILIDGTNIKDFTLESYRSKMAIVFQETTLFNGTIRHNLEYVKDGVTEEEIRAACKKAKILDFIDSLENGFETEVGERGLKLSGGEKQRLAIARVILKDPEILILDEATSSLDSMTEHLIQEALEEIMKDRTSIVIAHRLSTIKSADRIFLFEEGELIGTGSHKELYQKSPVYKEMVDFQKNGFIE
ncbi:MAG: ABC transporter ATP-binding protein [Candidatus Gracilibacteria bacterium]|nr:ABC transporter ATP-binding protein [Candidatus Gracilibacteria bacterium]MDD3120054.1 ABC transporter ATP-binding protein [Candidatus Gracilibacteria bacterium]MDD4530245.1 ABC transporter ATP-binding protein [Candidatus Gracilibacteria bacterium]